MKFKFNLFERSPVKKQTVVGLTSAGSAKCDSLYGIEGAKGQVLLMLKDAGPSTLSDIADETKLSPPRVKSIVRELISNGFARKVGGGAEE